MVSMIIINIKSNEYRPSQGEVKLLIHKMKWNYSFTLAYSLSHNFGKLVKCGAAAIFLWRGRAINAFIVV